MGITVYSLAISIVFYNLALIAVFILRRSPGFRARHTVSLLAFITVLGVVRLVLPIDFDVAYVVRSYKIIPAIEDFLKHPVVASLTPGMMLLVIWFAGSVITLVKKLRIQRAFDRSLCHMDFVDNPRILDIASEFGGNFAVLVSPQLRSSYTSGLLHPVIYLPDLDLSDDEWRMIFCHEITHIRSYDNWKKLFFLAVETVFWWNPLAHFSEEEINTLLEMRCDAKVTADMTEQERFDYATLLKKLIELSAQKTLPVPVSPIVGSREQMRTRFLALTHPICFGRPQYTVLAILVMLFAISYCIIVQPARIPAADMLADNSDHVVSIISDLDISMGNSLANTTIVFEDGKYYLYIDDKYAATLHEEEIFEMANNKIPILGG